MLYREYRQLAQTYKIQIGQVNNAIGLYARKLEVSKDDNTIAHAIKTLKQLEDILKNTIEGYEHFSALADAQIQKNKG